MSSLQLASEFTRFTELRRRLIEADPEIDETTLLDTLEGATNLTEAIGEVRRVPEPPLRIRGMIAMRHTSSGWDMP